MTFYQSMHFPKHGITDTVVWLRDQESVKRKAAYWEKASGYSSWDQREVEFTFIFHFQDAHSC